MRTKTTKPLPLHYLTRTPLTDLDRMNIKAAKQQVAPDILVKLTPYTSGAEHVLAFGYKVQDNDLPVGAVVHLIDSAHHATLQEALRQMIYGMPEDWEAAVWNIEMIGGK